MAFISETRTFPATNNSFFGRLFLWFSSQPGLPIRHWTNIEGVGENKFVRYGGQASKGVPGLLVANIDGGGASDLFQHSATVMPTDRWVCVEWQFKGDTSDMHLWLDGNEVPDLAIKNAVGTQDNRQPWTAPAFSQLDLGWQMYAGDAGVQTVDQWIDEVAVDSQRIGCTR
jgi:hypothetical protein